MHGNRFDFFPGGDMCPYIAGEVKESGQSLEVTLADAPDSAAR